MTDKANTTEQPAGIGHNAPPIEELLASISAELLAGLDPIAERANGLPKVIKTEADLALVTPVVVDAKALSKKIEKMRTDEKAPYLAGGRAVDAFFNPSKARLDRIASVFERLAGDFQREKIATQRREAEEAERKAAADAERLRREAEEVVKPETKQKRLDAAAEADNAADRAAAAATAETADLAKVTTAGGTVRGQTFWNFAIEKYDDVDLNSIRDFIDRDAVEKAIRAKIKIQKGNTEINGVRVFEDVKTSIR